MTPFFQKILPVFPILFTVTCLSGQAVPAFKPSSPVSHPLIFSGSFGELRGNHFHSGVDIKASRWGQAGDQILAVSDGSISRVKVESGGYGNSIYIDHPEGYTSVYAHLDRFSEPLASYVKDNQYQFESFEADLYPEPGQFPVKRGQVIGYMGNTGSSMGAHLHFELRHLDTEKPVNPQAFGISPPDTRLPVIESVQLALMYPDTAIFHLQRWNATKASNGWYRLSKDTLELDAWRIGVEVSGHDLMNGAPNQNGIYEIEMYVDGNKAYHYRMDSFSFYETQHINAHINYPEFRETRKKFQRCYILPGDPLSIYRQENDSIPFIIPLYREKPQQILILAKDIHGNESRIAFWVKRKPVMTLPPPLLHNYVLDKGKPQLIRSDEYILFIPDSALYQKTYLNLSLSDTIEPPFSSPQLYIRSNNIFKNPVGLYLKPTGIPDSLWPKAAIVNCEGSRLRSYGGVEFEQFLYTGIWESGDYVVFVDTIAPQISPVNFNRNMAKQRSVSFQIRDNLSLARNGYGLSYRAWIDHKWVLFSYDLKTDTITHIFDKNLPSGEHLLKIELIDNRNNTTIFEKKFIR